MPEAGCKMTQECKRLQTEIRYSAIISYLFLLNLFLAGFCWYWGEWVGFLAAFAAGICFRETLGLWIRRTDA